MIITRYFFILGLCLTLLFAVDANAGKKSRISFDSDSQEQIEHGVIDQNIWIMPQLNKLNFGLGWSNNNSFYYEKSLSKIFFQDDKLKVKITDIDFDETIITLKLFHPEKGNGIITFVFNQNLIPELSDESIQEILLTTLGDVNHQHVFVNPNSRTYHLYSCLHLERKSGLIRMSKEDAENQGFQPGGFCFNKMVYLPDLSIESKIEVHWLARLREHALFTEVPEKQGIVDRLGQRILDDWPFQLLGYNYSFHVISSRVMTAMALPKGKIFISTALMDALESEEEIEALLVRAIAHIENRHSLKQYQIKFNATTNKQFLKKLTTAFGSFTGVVAGPGAGAITALGNMPFQISSSDRPLSLGFDSHYEKVADAVAALYFDLHGKDRRHLSMVIKKQQLAAMYFNSQDRQKFDLSSAINTLELEEITKEVYSGFWNEKKAIHLNERANRAKQIKFVYFDDDNSFVYQKGQNLPIRLDLQYQSVFKNENKVYLKLSDRSLLYNPDGFDNQRVVTLLVHDKHGKQRFKLRKEFTTEDMWGYRLTFEAPRGKPSRLLEDVQRIKLKIKGPADKGYDTKVDNFKFVKSRLESENRMAEHNQTNS